MTIAVMVFFVVGWVMLIGASQGDSLSDRLGWRKATPLDDVHTYSGGL